MQQAHMKTEQCITQLKEVDFSRFTLLQKIAATYLFEAKAKMPIGKLTVHLPGSQVLLFGQGHSPEAEIHVHSLEMFDRLLAHGHIGFGESYLAEEWTTPSLFHIISWFILNYPYSPVLEGSGSKNPLFNLLGVMNVIQHLFRHNSVENSRVNIAEHYDLSNDFFKLFLDPQLIYSSGIYKNDSDTLEIAQKQKFEALAQKLRLKSSDHVLEIGSGWGAFAIYMAKEFGCHVTTITISQQQFDYAKKRIQAEGLEDKITILLKDYRDVEGQFDKIISIEMIEAVGEKYLDVFFKTCNDRLKPEGLLVLQMITSPDSRYHILRDNVDFIQKHIFPGTLLPSLRRINQSLRKAGDLHLFELDDIGLSYAKTLRAWLTQFEAKLDRVRALGFDDVFIRKWRYYLEYCEAAFATRNISDVQAVYTRPNNPNLMEAFANDLDS